MGVNLYLASEYEYRRGLANRLLEEDIIDFCLADHFPWTESPDHDDRIVEVDHRPSANDEYKIVCDMNELPAVSKDLIERMQPYESMAIKMGMRFLNMPITEYEEEKRKYLQHLRYWNYMLDHYHINLIVTHNTPHSQGKYVVYALSRVKKIPMLIWDACGTFGQRRFWGDSLSSIGKSVGDRYLELTRKRVNDFVLEDDIINDYDILKNKVIISERKQYDTKIITDRATFYAKSYKDKRRRYIYQYFRQICRSIIKTRSLDLFNQNRQWFRICRRRFYAYQYYKRHLECPISEYNKIAKTADMTQRYIVFFLQVFPEANVMPRAGVFSEQYNSIQLLARAADRCGVYVYVKEHPHNPGRSWDFYDEIRYIRNVILIKTNVLSQELIENSLGVATQSGTCIWEAISLKKPVFAFGNAHYWKHCPGVIDIVDEEQGESVIRKAIEGIKIEEADIKRYLFAIQLETLKEVNPEEEIMRVMDNSYKIPEFDLSDRVRLIKSFISQSVDCERLYND